MQAQIRRGRIHVRWDPEKNEEWVTHREQTMVLIGSSSVSDETDPSMSCAISRQNLKKLRAMGCSLDDGDLHTMTVIEKMVDDFRAYEAESVLGNKAKAQTAHRPDSYKFKMPPFAHQVEGWNFLHSMKTPALFGDCGTGKTFMVLTFAESLKEFGEDIAMVVVCPVNLIKHVWQVDANKFTDMKCVSLREPTVMSVRMADYDKPGDPCERMARASVRGARALDPTEKAIAKKKARARHNKKLKERFAQEADVYVINPESLRTDSKEKRVGELLKRLKAAGKKIILAIDESSKIKSRVSRTYRAIRRMRAFAERCIIMTGTPSPNGVLDIWAQFHILDGGMTLQPSFTDYRHEVAHEIELRGLTYTDKSGKKRNAKKWSPRAGAAIKVYKTIEPRMIRFQTSKCIDLPPARFIVRDVEMNQIQQDVYNDMEAMMFSELEGQPITAKIAASKILKLREITGGFVITDSGEHKMLGKTTPKIIELDNLLQQTIGATMGESRPSKALVWAQYQWECKTLVARYENLYGARGLYGGISSSAKDHAIESFMQRPHCRLLICHPASVGHGLTLTEADYAIYYSLSYNFEEFYQSYRRNNRAGQTRKMTYFFLVCPGTIDENLLHVMGEKKDFSDIITDGEFTRDMILDTRKRDDNQIRMEWEVPDDSSTKGSK